MKDRAWLCDWAVTAYVVVVSILLVVRAPAVPYWWAFLLGHLAVLGGVWALVRFDRPGLVGVLRMWDTLWVIPALFVMAMLIVHAIHPVDYDDVLIRIDRGIGGLALLASMTSIETAWLTSFFKLTWIGYYPLAILVGVPLHRKGREHLKPAKNALILGWVVSFLCYFALPAKGPGWHQEATGVPQPRFEANAISSAAKAMIAAAESPEPRHTFPSGHTIIAVITMWYLWRHRAGAWMWFGVPLSMAIVLSTVYLRYHYVVDVVAGVAVAIACVAVASGPRGDAAGHRAE